MSKLTDAAAWVTGKVPLLTSAGRVASAVLVIAGVIYFFGIAIVTYTGISAVADSLRSILSGGLSDVGGGMYGAYIYDFLVIGGVIEGLKLLGTAIAIKLVMVASHKLAVGMGARFSVVP